MGLRNERFPQIQIQIYLEYHSVCPLIGIGVPHSLSPQQMWTPPPWTKGGGGRSPAGEGVGES